MQRHECIHNVQLASVYFHFTSSEFDMRSIFSFVFSLFFSGLLLLFSLLPTLFPSKCYATIKKRGLLKRIHVCDTYSHRIYTLSSLSSKLNSWICLTLKIKSCTKKKVPQKYCEHCSVCIFRFFFLLLLLLLSFRHKVLFNSVRDFFFLALFSSSRRKYTKFPFVGWFWWKYCIDVKELIFSIYFSVRCQSCTFFSLLQLSSFVSKWRWVVWRLCDFCEIVCIWEIGERTRTKKKYWNHGDFVWIYILCPFVYVLYSMFNQIMTKVSGCQYIRSWFYAWFVCILFQNVFSTKSL